jgi:hypothetical protein
MDTTSNPTPPAGHVGRYRLLEKLGAGGMGEVYRGHDPLLDRVVAVKLPYFHGPPEHVARLAQRFQREARAAAQIHHPHVCPVYDVGEHDGQPYVVMAFLPGPSLAQRLAAGRFEDVGEAVRIARQLLDGLAAVHALGVVHRDLKPGNVLFDAAGRAVLTDFGLARPDSETPLTSVNAVLGTPAYMAPEQAAGQLDRIGPATDLYSLGVVLYQMMTGKLPFEGPAAAVLPRVVAEMPPPPCHFRPDLDPALEAAILRALRKDSAERFRDAAEFAAALDGRVSDSTTLAEPPRLSPPIHPVPGNTLWLPSRILGWLAGGLLIAPPAALLASFARAFFTDMRPGREFLILGGIFAAVIAWCVGALGVAVWGWVESVYVPEGLFYFARHGLVGWARRALEHGVPPDERNELGETPLLLAAANGQSEMVKLLLLHGANPLVPDHLGQTPLDAARAKGYADIADLLRRQSGRADTGPVEPAPRRPTAWRWLLVAVIVGVLLVVHVSKASADRVGITERAFCDLAKAGQIKEVTFTENHVHGEVKDPLAPKVRPLVFPGKKFWAPLLADTKEKVRQDLQGVKTTIATGAWPPEDVWPGLWLEVPMLAWPLAVLGLGLLPLLGSSQFPFLALRGRAGAR